MIETIYVDMDEVLVDFSKGYCRYIGINYNDVLKAWPRGEWLMLPALNAVMNLAIPLDIPTFWKWIEGNNTFWEELEKTPWCDDLWRTLHKYGVDVHILSSPSKCDTCYTGKVRWLKQKFGRDFDNFHLTPHKEKLARPGAVLIDDSEKNCHNFLYKKNGRSTGAQSIVFPRHSNGMGNIADPVGYICSQLEDIINPYQGV